MKKILIAISTSIILTSSVVAQTNQVPVEFPETNAQAGYYFNAVKPDGGPDS